MARNVSLGEVIQRAQESRVADIWTAIPAVVQSYDPTTRTADLRPLTLRPVRNVDTEEIEHEELPILPSVPVAFPGAKGFRIEFPIDPGTTGIVVFLTLSAAKWRTGAADGTTPAEPGDQRLHHPGNGVFLPGLLPDTATTPATSVAALTITAAEIRLGDETAPDTAARASTTNARLDALESFMSSHVHHVAAAPGDSDAAAGFSAGGGDVASPTIKIP